MSNEVSARARRALILFGAVYCAAETLNAGSFAFERISRNATTDLAPQLRLDVESVDADTIRFRIENSGPVHSVVTHFYVDDNETDRMVKDTFTLIDDGNGGDPGVNYFQFADPIDLPGGSAAPLPFQVTSYVRSGRTRTISADANTPPSRFGINPGEWLGVEFDLAAGKSLEDLEAAMSQNDAAGLRLGVLAQVLSPTSAADSYVSRRIAPPPPPHAVPETTQTLPMLALSTLGIAAYRLRRLRASVRGRA